ncbi:fimbrial protein [Leminorella grimontii]|uniref:fimbrial protein n=1 Tax=Leminorella grimontii TaxID=82981 RepID=UPI00208D229D|nr:fimbrial protein [Leminorella grimontii]GKX60779.1 major fimbrial protein SthE [Leminorella grimontii]
MKKARIAYALFIALALLPMGKAFASCSFSGGGGTIETTIKTPSVIYVKRNAEPGTILFDSGWVSGGNSKVSCSWTSTATVGYYGATPASPYGNGVITSTNSSVGIRLYYSNSNDTSYGQVVPSERSSSSFYDGMIANTYTPAAYYRMELVLVDTVREGTITMYSPLALTTYDPVTTTEAYASNPINIYPQSLSCQVNTTQLQVPLGDVQSNSLTQVGATTVSKDFQIGLTCESGTIVSVAMTGTQNGDTSDDSVLALTNAGQSGVATGLGVQILQDSQPLHIGETRMVVSSANTSELLNFTARYYQTRPKVTPGSANTTALLTMVYQ